MSRARDTADQINRVNSSAADATAITVDSSENVLVGTTDSTPYDNTSGNGILLGDGLISSAQEGGNTAIFNRMTSDGSIVQFRKDGSAVGSIQTRGGTVSTLILDPRTNGGGLTGTANAVMPTSNAGAIGDANTSLDLGASGYAFRNAYLSGGIYLGGTAAVNKLDDYEEGTWTPSAGTGTISSNFARYTKVGNLVTIIGNIYSFSDRSSSNGVGIQGLPFTGSSTARTTGSVMIRNSDNTTITAAYITSSSNTVEFYGVTSGVWDQLKHNDLNNSSSEIYFNITYRTNA